MQSPVIDLTRTWGDLGAGVRLLPLGVRAASPDVEQEEAAAVDWDELRRLVGLELADGALRPEEEPHGTGTTAAAVARDYARIVVANFGGATANRYRLRFPAFGGRIVVALRVNAEIGTDAAVPPAVHRIRLPGFASALKRAGLLMVNTHRASLGNAIVDLRPVRAAVVHGLRVALEERSRAGGYAGAMRVRRELMAGVWPVVVDRLMRDVPTDKVAALEAEFCACFFFIPLVNELVPVLAMSPARRLRLATERFARLAEDTGVSGSAKERERDRELLKKACDSNTSKPHELPLGAFDTGAADETLPLFTGTD